MNKKNRFEEINKLIDNKDNMVVKTGFVALGEELAGSDETINHIESIPKLKSTNSLNKTEKPGSPSKLSSTNKGGPKEKTPVPETDLSNELGLTSSTDDLLNYETIPPKPSKKKGKNRFFTNLNYDPLASPHTNIAFCP